MRALSFGFSLKSLSCPRSVASRAEIGSLHAAPIVAPGADPISAKCQVAWRHKTNRRSLFRVMVLMEDDVSTELPPIPWAPMAAPAVGFDALYATEFPRLAGVLYAMGGSRSLAEEVAQDAFAHAWARWSRVSASPSPAGWV